MTRRFTMTMTFLPIMLVLCICIASAKFTQDRGEVWKNNKRIFSAKQPHRILIRLASNQSRLRKQYADQSTPRRMAINQECFKQLADNQSTLRRLTINQARFKQLADNEAPFQLSAIKQLLMKYHGKNAEINTSKDVYRDGNPFAKYKR